jgi:hypothetical protein
VFSSLEAETCRFELPTPSPHPKFSRFAGVNAAEARRLAHQRDHHFDSHRVPFLYCWAPRFAFLEDPMPKHCLTVFLLIIIIACASLALAQENREVHQPTLIPQKSGTTQLLISVSPVNSRVVWAAGTGGTYVVTTDGGANWKAAVVPGAENLQFRDVQGVSDKVAYLLSIGNKRD